MRDFCQIVVQGLFVFQVSVATTDKPDCCPEVQVQGEGSSSGTYILVPTSYGPHIHHECREACHYVKDKNPDPEQLFCFVRQFEWWNGTEWIGVTVVNWPTCQNYSTDIEVAVLSLNETESEEFSNIYQRFPPPIRGEEFVTFYSENCTEVILPIDSIGSLESMCNVLLLDENSLPSCEEQWKTCSQRLAIPALASCNLKWCPGRIGQNQNLLYRWPQCCYHPETQTPSGDLWGCLLEYTSRNTTDASSVAISVDFFDDALTHSNRSSNVTCCHPDNTIEVATCGQGASCAGACSALDASLCPRGNCKDYPVNCELTYKDNEDEQSGGSTATLSGSDLKWCTDDRCDVRIHPECCYNPDCLTEEWPGRKEACRWLDYL